MPLKKKLKKKCSPCFDYSALKIRSFVDIISGYSQCTPDTGSPRQINIALITPLWVTRVVTSPACLMMILHFSNVALSPQRPYHKNF